MDCKMMTLNESELAAVSGASGFGIVVSPVIDAAPITVTQLNVGVLTQVAAGNGGTTSLLGSLAGGNASGIHFHF